MLLACVVPTQTRSSGLSRTVENDFFRVCSSEWEPFCNCHSLAHKTGLRVPKETATKAHTQNTSKATRLEVFSSNPICAYRLNTALRRTFGGCSETLAAGQLPDRAWVFCMTKPSLPRGPAVTDGATHEQFCHNRQQTVNNAHKQGC